MICKECGADVNSNEVFCPNCGAPLRVTADYDYIQAEIGVKVDQFLNDGSPEASQAGPDTVTDQTLPRPVQEHREEIARTVRIPKDPGLNIIGSPSSRMSSVSERPAGNRESKDSMIAITRTLYVKDSIFADEDAPDFEEEEEEEIRESSRPRSSTAAIKKKMEQEKARKKKKRILIIAIIAAVVVLGILAIIIFGGKKEDEEINDTITCNIEDGKEYDAPLEIKLWSEKDYRIVYTLDGSEPTVSTGTKYGDPIKLTNADVTGESMQMTLTAYSYSTNASIKAGQLKVTFTLKKSQIAAPVMSLDSGDYYEPQTISITGPEGATIYYTYDGSTPGTNSTKYTGPIEMKRGNYILSAIAIDESGVSSDVTSNVYNLVIESAITYEQAQGNVLNMLVSEGLIEGTTPDENGNYKVPGGGTRRVINGGTAIVENTNYYVVQVDYMNDGSSVQATTYYGVNDQDGEIVRLNKSGMTFVYA